MLKRHPSYLNGHFIHTYMIGHYNPSVGTMDLVSHTTYVVCINFILLDTSRPHLAHTCRGLFLPRAGGDNLRKTLLFQQNYARFNITGAYTSTTLHPLDCRKVLLCGGLVSFHYFKFNLKFAAVPPVFGVLS